TKTVGAEIFAVDSRSTKPEHSYVGSLPVNAVSEVGVVKAGNARAAVPMGNAMNSIGPSEVEELGAVAFAPDSLTAGASSHAECALAAVGVEAEKLFGADRRHGNGICAEVSAGIALYDGIRGVAAGGRNFPTQA